MNPGKIQNTRPSPRFFRKKMQSAAFHQFVCFCALDFFHARWRSQKFTDKGYLCGIQNLERNLEHTAFELFCQKFFFDRIKSKFLTFYLIWFCFSMNFTTPESWGESELGRALYQFITEPNFNIEHICRNEKREIFKCQNCKNVM